MIDTVYKAYKTTKDKEDFVDSIQRLYKKMNAPAPVPMQNADPKPILVSGHKDPFVEEVEALKA